MHAHNDQGTHRKQKSTCCKMGPSRESKFHWLFKKMAFLTFQHFLQTAKTEKSLAAAKRKAKTKFRQLIKQDTIEHRLCSNKKINFSSLSPSTLLKYSPTFKRKFPSQFALFLDNSSFSKNNLHLGEKLARAAYHQKAPPALLNKLWKCTPIKLNHAIALLQTSASMLHNYSAIALAIRISEEAKEPLKNQVILFSQQPKLIRFEENKTFTEKVAILKQEMEGLGNKLYPAIHFLAQELQKITKCVPNVKVIIISNMQIEPEHLPDPFTLTTNIKKIFKKNKTTIPQIILWNMKSSDGFPGLYFEKNITMISGNNHHLLKYLPNNNPTRRPYTTTITKIINSKRYSIMDRILMDCVL